MNRQSATWSIILAAGEGSRLKSLTTRQSGETVPKQFCSLYGGASLLHETIRRALSISSPSHLCAVVSERHRCWWEQALWPISEDNIIVQPENRGTANGILLPLLHVFNRDPHANIVLLPSDHYLADEAVLSKSIRQAVVALSTHPHELILLGIEPEEVDPELGYIVPEYSNTVGPARVLHFVEKPSFLIAQKLINRGALWNAFIVVTRAATLLNMLIEQDHEAVWDMQATLACQQHDRNALTELYQRLPVKDFSQHVLQGMEHRLRVMQVRKCGWSDLGTPKRIEQMVQKLAIRGRPVDVDHGHLNLAWQYEKQLTQQDRSLSMNNIRPS